MPGKIIVVIGADQKKQEQYIEGEIDALQAFHQDVVWINSKDEWDKQFDVMKQSKICVWNNICHQTPFAIPAKASEESEKYSKEMLEIFTHVSKQSDRTLYIAVKLWFELAFYLRSACTDCVIMNATEMNQFELEMTAKQARTGPVNCVDYTVAYKCFS